MRPFPGPPARRPAERRSALLGMLLVGAVAMTACSAAAPQPTPSSASESAPAPEPTETAPAAPALVPDGSAADNLPIFTAIMQQVAAGPEAVAGRAYVDALVGAGFNKAAMQVTADRTSVDDPVDSLQFSVLWGQECLVGQVGPSTPAPTALVLPELPSGGCLIGQTRPIDW
ncbi:DUF6993 domain-containing protein [Microbacterium radiodurans]|nr:hypothetical protein [Microbacterium radiodurans]